MRKTQLQSVLSEFKRFVDIPFSDEEKAKIEAQNCQNFVGSVQIPVGVVGPCNAKIYTISRQSKISLLGIKNVLIPLATTEGALVPSVNRGMKVLREAGDVRVFVKNNGMSRAPVFLCKSATAAWKFLHWFKQHESLFTEECCKTSKHMKYLHSSAWVEGAAVYIRMSFDTDQAMGMNMVTVAIAAAWRQLRVRVPTELGVQLLSISSNVCTDKKHAHANLILGRGYEVHVEAELDVLLLEKILKTSLIGFLDVVSYKNEIGSRLAGSATSVMQVANVIAAFYSATGQDGAHVVDASSGATSYYVVSRHKGRNTLVCNLKLPTVVLGAVGGGTWLPDQNQAQQVIFALDDGGGTPLAAELAAVLGVGCLAAELSGLAALSSGSLACAHEAHGRGAREKK